jgi:hypothetical protein
MIGHPEDSTIELFAMGALGEEEDAFVAHVAGCDECSRKLQREATLELTLMDVRAALGAEAHAAVDATEPARPKRARRVLGPAFVFAAAAALLLWLGRDAIHPRQPTAEVKPVPVVACPEGPRQLECIAAAHRDGAYLEYPKGTALAALGSTPGLTLSIALRGSRGVVEGIEDFIAKVESEMRHCADHVLVSQEAPMLTGEVAVDFAVSPEGRVSDARTSTVVHTSLQAYQAATNASAVARDSAMAECLGSAVIKVPLTARERPTRVEMTAKYVWRE